MIRNLILFCASVLFGCILLELVLRLFFPVPAPWLEPQIRHLESPLLGWVLPPSTDAFTIDAPVRVNSLGLRDAEIPLQKPPGTQRVLCLGDSFTFALGVRLENLYVKQLEWRLAENHPERAIEVLNAGVAGYNTRQELITYLTLGQQLDPDLVVVGFYWNDLVGNEQPLPDLLTTPRIASGSELASEARSREHTIPAPLRNLLRRSVLLYLSVTGGKAVLAQFSPPTDAYSIVQKALLEGDAATLKPYWDATAKRLLEIAAAAKQRGVPVILLVFPGENEVKYDFPKLEFGGKLREIWSPTGFPMIDLTDRYRASLRAGKHPYLPYDLHPNPLGMKIAADALFDVIHERGYLGLGPRP